jgi:hypothetical protein
MVQPWIDDPHGIKTMHLLVLIYKKETMTSPWIPWSKQRRITATFNDEDFLSTVPAGATVGKCDQLRSSKNGQDTKQGGVNRVTNRFWVNNKNSHRSYSNAIFSTA